jgi:hypothetical protein
LELLPAVRAGACFEDLLGATFVFLGVREGFFATTVRFFAEDEVFFAGFEALRAGFFEALAVFFFLGLAIKVSCRHSLAANGGLIKGNSEMAQGEISSPK